MENTARLIPQEEKEIREKNMEAIRRYMDYSGHERINRHEVYAEEFRGGMFTMMSGKDRDLPGGKEGREFKRRSDEANTEQYPDWMHSDMVFYQTIDPSLYLVTCKGFGYFMNPFYNNPFYLNEFFNTFIVKDGKLLEYLEHFNTSRMTGQFGVKTPKLKRPKRIYPVREDAK